MEVRGIVCAAVGGGMGVNMKITVNTSQTKEALGDMFGIFFEDLNHAADGGLYAELVQNRSFEFAPIDHPDYHALTAWEKIETDGEARLLIETGNPVSNKNPHYLAVDVNVPGRNVGVQNVGFNTGIPLQEGESYYFTCYAKREQSFDQPLCVSLRSKEGEVYSQQEIILDKVWKKYELEFIAPYTDYSGRLALTVLGRGKVYLDFVSLFPKDTYKGRRNGLRRDLAEKLAELKPKFMRFPGGCLVHDGSLDPDVRDSMYRWKNTIGPVEERPARRSNWGYNQTLGLGYYEYFLFCEDIGAKPLPVLPGAYDPHHQRITPLEELKPWIDDALDLIEFANGDIDTVWGAKRAELGHPDPFGMEYIGIGNEEVGEPFFERYPYFHGAIKERYPDIKIINSSGPFAAGSEYDRGWESARENHSDLVDEHYYQSPDWFLANHHRYDSFKREDPKVFLGEYASWGHTVYNALAEATYMIGLERNAHAVGLACYAPLLCNVDYVNWGTDMIWFNNHQLYGTVNYYVQKIFMHHQGDYLLEMKSEGHEVIKSDFTSMSGIITMSGHQSSVRYVDISLTNDDTGEVTKLGERMIDMGEEAVLINNASMSNYTLTCKATEMEGWKGFEIEFARKDEKNKMNWVIGGWQNFDNCIGEDINGRNSCLSQSLFSVEKGKEYTLELRVQGRRIKASIDGVTCLDFENKQLIIEPLYYSASKDIKTDEVIVKVVNMQKEKVKAPICLEHMTALTGSVISIEGYELTEENNFDSPTCVQPKERSFSSPSNSFEYEFDRESFTIFRLKNQISN